MYSNISIRRGVLRLTPLAVSTAALFASGHASAQALPDGSGIGLEALKSQWRLGEAAHAVRAPSSRHAPSQIASTVSSCGDDPSDFGTLRHAVLTANTGGTVDLTGLACSKITLTQGAIAVGLADLTIQGPGMNALTIDGNGTDRVFLHTGTGTLTLNDVTITHGTMSADKAYGGCIYSVANVSLTGTTVTGCNAMGQTIAAGGGIVTKGTLAMDMSVLSNNLADTAVGMTMQVGAAAGGALAASSTNVSFILDSVISGNVVHTTAGHAEGGGIVAGSMWLKYSTVTNNAANGPGTATDYSAGGGLVSSSLLMKGSTVDNNIADAAGGAFLSQNGSGTASIALSTISTNKARLAVGGVWAHSPLTLTSTTFAFNLGGTLGGAGLTVDSSVPLTLQNTIVADNSPSDIDGSSAITGDHNIVKITGMNAPMLPVGTLGTDPQLAPLARNGGTTRTHLLTLGSPAIEAGVSAAKFDQRGSFYPRKVGAKPDIGAVEFDPDHIFGDGFDAP
ncbi:MAG TPA: choice-of-anchor Q domain-containing protein [Rudaea sp.]